MPAVSPWRASGRKEDGCPWTVGVRDPSDPNAFSDVVSLTDGAVASSGNYEKDFGRKVEWDPVQQKIV